MKFTLFTLITLVSAASAGLSKSPSPQHNPNQIHLTPSSQASRCQCSRDDRRNWQRCGIQRRGGSHQEASHRSAAAEAAAEEEEQAIIRSIYTCFSG